MTLNNISNLAFMNGILQIKSRIKTRMILVINISTLDTKYTKSCENCQIRKVLSLLLKPQVII